MTIIAWDGTTMAADKQATASGFALITTKIFRLPIGIVGFSGDSGCTMRLLEWLKRGGLEIEYPTWDDKNNADALLVTPKCEVFYYSSDCKGIPEIIGNPFVAMGGGRDYALATMHLGHNAVKAVEVTCALDVFCGCGIDALNLYEDPDEAFKVISDRYTEINGIIRLNPDADTKPYDMKIIHFLCDEWDFAFEC